MRDIKLIFDDVYDLTTSINGSGILSVSPFYDNRSGDSQILEQDFILVMHNALMDLIDYAAKPVKTKPYSALEYVIFDTGYLGMTAAQKTESIEYLNNGYRNVGSYERPRGNYYNIASVGLVRPIVQAGRNGSTYAPWHDSQFYLVSKTDEPLYGRLGEYNDKFEYTEFTAVQNGTYFDPSLVKMDTKPEIDSWFEAYDSILTELKAAYYTSLRELVFQSQVPFDAQMSLTSVTDSSDKYNVKSEFFEYFWYDDLTGDSGSVVEQQVTLFREGDTQQGLFYKLYSQNLTYSVDDGQGGYDTVTLSTTNNGSTFNDPLETLHANAPSLLTNTYSYNLGLTHYRLEQVYNVLGTYYTGGDLNRSGDGVMSITALEIKEDHATLNAVNYYSYISEQYITRLYSGWSRSATLGGPALNPADAPQTLIETRLKNTDDVYDTYTATSGDFTLSLPDITERSEATLTFFKTVTLEPLNDYNVVVLTPPV